MTLSQPPDADPPRSGASSAESDRKASPASLGRGEVGVFAGDWTRTPGTRRFPIRYVGTLIDTWNGYAVFYCTRTVAEAIVDNHQREREQLRDRLRADGYSGDDLDARVNTSTTNMYWLGENLVIDQRGLHANPHAITWVPAGPDGTYIINGYTWTWIAIDPADCDHIIEPACR